MCHIYNDSLTYYIFCPDELSCRTVMDGGRGVETFVTIFKADNCSLFSGCRFGCGGGVLTSDMDTASFLVTARHLLLAMLQNSILFSSNDMLYSLYQLLII